MKALVHTAPLTFEFKDVPKPQPGDDEALVRVKAVGICGSDVHGYTGTTGRRIPPLIMGHEAAGIVETVGRNVKNVAAGDRITFDSTIYCNQCPACRQGRVNLCQNRKVMGVATPTFHRDGAMAEYVLVPWWIIYRLPDAVSFEEAALVEPAGVGMHAARITPIEVNDVVAVVGAGQIGLLAMQGARIKGAGTLIVLDMKEDRLAVARQLGAHVTINPTKGDVAEQMRKAVGRPDVDVAFEAVGNEAAVKLAIDLTKLGGNVTLIGNVTPKIQVNLQDIVSHEVTIRGSCAIAGEYPACLNLMAQGRLQVKPFISRVMPLAEGKAAFDALHHGEAGLMKIVLHP
ncbi:MAG TPA: galactitol-1-phosphate 5-dehydrogenase [Candidatus Methylomirabilis sp.]|nr:galactitol-1-phosphate 5-dehydrogenase [Candidatus Methylomirabilis sp.]